MMPFGTNVGLDLGPNPNPIVLHRDPAPSLKRAQPPSLRPMSIVVKRSPISATAEHLFLCANCE